MAMLFAVIAYANSEVGAFPAMVVALSAVEIEITAAKSRNIIPSTVFALHRATLTAISVVRPDEGLPQCVADGALEHLATA